MITALILIFVINDVRSGFILQVSKSNSNDVTLVNVSRNLTGLYKCEVSAGSPSYHTLINRARMEVVGE